MLGAQLAELREIDARRSSEAGSLRSALKRAEAKIASLTSAVREGQQALQAARVEAATMRTIAAQPKQSQPHRHSEAAAATATEYPPSRPHDVAPSRPHDHPPSKPHDHPPSRPHDHPPSKSQPSSSDGSYPSAAEAIAQIRALKQELMAKPDERKRDERSRGDEHGKGEESSRRRLLDARSARATFCAFPSPSPLVALRILP